MYYLLYLSVANGLMNDDELAALLSKSRVNNQRKQLTGVLLYGNGRFIQLLEGSEDQVKRTFGIIKSDTRHLDITVIASGDIGERCFPEWFMGFKAFRAESYATMEGFLDLSREAIERDDCLLPVKLLQSFVKKNRLNVD